MITQLLEEILLMKIIGLWNRDDKMDVELKRTLIAVGLETLVSIIAVGLAFGIIKVEDRVRDYKEKKEELMG